MRVEGPEMETAGLPKGSMPPIYFLLQVLLHFFPLHRALREGYTSVESMDSVFLSFLRVFGHGQGDKWS